MPSAIAPVIKSGRGVHCVSGHPPRLPSVEEEKGQGLHRSRTLSEMDHTKRCAIVLERDQSLSSNPQLAHWSNETRDEVKRALSSHIPHEHSERRSRYHTKDELLNTRGSIRRDTLRRKPVPPIPAELKEAYTQANNHHHRPSNPSPPSTRRHQSVPRTSAATSSTLTSSPKSIESDLRTLVDDDDEWDFLSSDMDPCMGPVVQDLDDVPPITVFINIRTKAAKEEASRRTALAGRKKNIACSREGCNSVLPDLDALTSHLVKHDLASNLKYYGQNVIYTCLTKGCRCAFTQKEELDKHRAHCGWSIEPVNPTPAAPKTLFANVKTGIAKHISLVHA